MRYAVEMSSGVMIYIPKFHKDSLRHPKVDTEKELTDTHVDLISLLLFFQNKKMRVKMIMNKKLNDNCRV
jgi:hypothetical protein